MPQTCKTVRGFISSTFRDMHAERGLLVEVVFPELRELLATRHLCFVDVDLSWGHSQSAYQALDDNRKPMLGFWAGYNDG